jgi:hypothetical protein
MVSKMGAPRKDGAKMDDNLPATDASPSGIAECLRMLADEAASLGLVRTFVGLLLALETCRAEGGAAAPTPKRRGQAEHVELLMN